MIGAAVPLGRLGIGEAFTYEIRGMVGTYSDWQTGVAYANSFAVLARFVTQTIDDTYICNVFIYASEQAYLSEYLPIGYENDVIPFADVTEMFGIFNGLYDELMKLSKYADFVAV